MKSISRVAVVVFGLMAIGLLSRCGGGQSALQQPSPPLVITTASLPNGTAETAYSQTIQASGGVAPYTWTVTAGNLPHNLSLATSATNSATFAGTPDVLAQGLAFTIKVTDSATHSATQVLHNVDLARTRHSFPVSRELELLDAITREFERCANRNA